MSVLCLYSTSLKKVNYRKVIGNYIEISKKHCYYYRIQTNMATLKQTLRDSLRQKYREEDLKQWFDPLRIRSHGQDASHIEVVMPHAFFFRWFFQTHQQDFEFETAVLLGPGTNIQYAVCEESAAENNNSEHKFAVKQNKPTSKEPDGQAGFFFSNFFYNKKNQFPVAAAKNTAQGKNLEPLLIYSKSGFGKTHILHAIYHEATFFYNKKNIYFSTLSKLETILKNNKKTDIPDSTYFTGAQLFLLDDFQDCEGKPGLQKRLCGLLEYFLSCHSQVCLTMDAEPDACSYLNDKLKSLLQSFILAELKKPDIDIKLNFIQYLSSIYSVRIKKEDALALARMYTNFREIQGALAKVAAFKRLAPNDDQSLFNILKVNVAAPESVHPLHIIKCVADFFGLEESAVQGDSRKSDIVRARQLSMFLCREMTQSPLSVIGRFFNNRDHSSVLYSINKIKKKIESNKDTHKLVLKVRDLCTKE